MFAALLISTDTCMFFMHKHIQNGISKTRDFSDVRKATKTQSSIWDELCRRKHVFCKLFVEQPPEYCFAL